jgi:hypothetical protein
MPQYRLRHPNGVDDSTDASGRDGRGIRQVDPEGDGK